MLGAVALLGACDGGHGNFSQHPGFAAYYAEHPPAASVPDAAEQARLARYRPRFFLSPGQQRPIDFYRDYIANGRLLDANGDVISEAVTPALLNAHRDDPLVRFEHRPPRAGYGPQPPVVYGRVEHARIALGDATPRSFEFLSYHVVFARSGLPAGLVGWRATLLGLLGDLDDWHQLDHYTAATVVLDERHRPIALVLQQHNYQHSYLFGEGVQLPDDGRPTIDIAQRSNELYPHDPHRRRHRAVNFLTPDTLAYLMGFEAAPWNSAEDITEGSREVDYRLEFIAPRDAFYTFQGYLGERRLLPGRDGPPGADYNALPRLKPWPVQFPLGYWREGAQDDYRRLLATWAANGDAREFAAAQAVEIGRRLQALSPPATD